jgi:hypothetical protein
MLKKPKYVFVIGQPYVAEQTSYTTGEGRHIIWGNAKGYNDPEGEIKWTTGCMIAKHIIRVSDDDYKEILYSSSMIAINKSSILPLEV